MYSLAATNAGSQSELPSPSSLMLQLPLGGVAPQCSLDVVFLLVVRMAQCGCDGTANVCLYARCGCERTADACIRELEADAPKQCLCEQRAPLVLVRDLDDEAYGSVVSLVDAINRSIA